MFELFARLLALLARRRHGMSKLDFRTFGGLMPKVAPQLLPDPAAQTATNVDVRRGDLRPVNTVSANSYEMTVLVCGTAGTVIATWAAITDGHFDISIDGTPASTAAIDFTGVTSMVQVSEKISDRLLSLEIKCYWDSTNTRFVFLGYDILGPLTVTGSGTDISGVGYINGLSATAAEVNTLRTITSVGGGKYGWFRDPFVKRVANNIITNDTYERLFMAGNGKPQQFYSESSVYTIYSNLLGIQVPTATPIATAVAKGSVTWTRTWYAYYEEPDGTQVDAFTEGVDFTVSTTTAGSVYYTKVGGVLAIPAKVTATANAVFVLYFDAYDADGALLGRLYPQHSAYKDNSDLFINGAEVTGNQLNTNTAIMDLTYDTSRVSDYSIDRKYVYAYLNYPFDQESAPSPASATISVSPAQNASVTNLGIYDPNTTYDTGDITVFVPYLLSASNFYVYTIQQYRCNSDATTGNWDATRWDRVEDTKDGKVRGSVDTIRLYRTVTTSAGTQYQFVADIDWETLQPKKYITSEDVGRWHLTTGAAVDLGGGLVRISCGSNPFVGGDYVSFYGTTNYTGNYYLHRTTTSSNLVITATYVAETFNETNNYVSSRVGQHQMNLDNSAVVDNGDGTVDIACTSHGFLDGEGITIAGTTNYNGAYTALAGTTGSNIIVITKAYVAETPLATATARWTTLVGITVEGHGLLAGERLDISSQGCSSYIGSVVSSSTTTNRVVFTATHVEALVLEGVVRPYSPRAYVDSIADADCGDVLATALWEPPPDTLDGLVNAPGGFLAGFVGNTVYCSEQYYPHAWPYQYTVPHAVVGLGISGNMIVVLTEGDPYGLVGDAPGALSLIRIPLKQSCVSISSIVSHLGKVYYASPDGMAVIAGGEGALLTGNLWTRAQWQTLGPTTLKCAIHDEQLYLNFGTASTYILDLSGVAGGQLTFTNETINALYSDPVTDLLYTTAAGYLKTINGGSTAKVGTWKSKDFLSAKPVRWSSGKVLAESYTVGANVVTNGTFTTDLTGWSVTNWLWSSGRLYCNNSAGQVASQTISSLVAGRAYRVTFDVLFHIEVGASATVTVSLGGTSGTIRVGPIWATFSETIIAGSSNTLLTFTPSVDFYASRIDNVIVEPLDVTLSLYADGALSVTIPVLSAAPFRIPSVTPKRRWSVELVTVAVINQVCLGTSMGAMIQLEPQV